MADCHSSGAQIFSTIPFPLLEQLSPLLVLTLVLSIVVREGEGVRGVDLSCLAPRWLLPMVASLDGHLAELAGVVGRALTFVPGTAFPTIHAG